MSGWSPFQSGSSVDAAQNDVYLEREIAALERTLGERGPLPRRELGRAVECRFWGPGRFGRALRRAVADGRIRRVRRGVYGPVE